MGGFQDPFPSHLLINSSHSYLAAPPTIFWPIESASTNGGVFVGPYPDLVWLRAPVQTEECLLVHIRIWFGWTGIGLDFSVCMFNTKLFLCSQYVQQIFLIYCLQKPICGLIEYGIDIIINKLFFALYFLYFAEYTVSFFQSRIIPSFPIPSRKEDRRSFKLYQLNISLDIYI